jgi:hypothetical protein
MAGRELQAAVSPLDGIVVADLSRFLGAQDLAPGAGGIGNEGCRATIKVREPDNQDERVFRGLC